MAIAFTSKRSILASALAVLLLQSVSATAFSPAQLKIVDHIKGADGGWDYATIDAAAHRLE